MSERIWAEPLTDNERAIIGSVLGRERGSEAAKWLRHVLKCYDARETRLARDPRRRPVDPNECQETCG